MTNDQSIARRALRRRPAASRRPGTTTRRFAGVFAAGLLPALLAATPASAATFTLTQPGNATNVQDCNGLKFHLQDTITIVGQANVTYTLKRNGSSNVDSVTRSGTGLANMIVSADLVSPPIPGAYSLVRRNGLGISSTIGSINVAFKPGFTCAERQAKSYGNEMWFHGTTSASRPVVGDFDNDRHEDDIAYYGLCGSSAQPCIRVEIGTGTIQHATDMGGSFWFYTEGPIGSPAAGDLDGDGFRDDIVYYGRCGTGFACLRAHFSNGTSFTTTQLAWDMWPADETPNSVLMVGDFDDDGRHDDIIYSGRCGNNGARCWRAHMGP